MLTELGSMEAERIWQVAESLAESETIQQVRDKWGMLAKSGSGESLSGESVALVKMFQVGKIVSRITDRLSRGDLSCAPGASTEDIDKILQAHENSEALLEALFSYAAAAVDQAFRYGYYAALEDEARLK